MPIVQSSTYRCFARFTFAPTSYALGTDSEYRAGVWHDPVLARDVSIEQQFSAGSMIDPRGFDLAIIDAPLGPYQQLVAAGGLDGVSVVVETVCDSLLSDGTTSTQTKTATLTIRGTRIEPGKVVISLVDIEDAKLNALYPAGLWTADTFRDIAQVDTGVAIPHPVGTARKLKAALLSADAVNSYWHFGVCNAPLLTLPIAAINTGTKTFTVAGNYTDRISAGTVLFSSTSSANPGRYVVASATYSAPTTLVAVVETLGSATVSGNLLVPPTVLAVYRDGRLVSPSEYTVEMTWPAATQFADADFDNVPADWVGIAAGTGSGTITAGLGRLIGDGGSVNSGQLRPNAIPVECQRGAHHVVTLTLTTPGRVRMSTFGVNNAGTAVISGQGTHTALVQEVPATGVRRVDLSTFNTGYSGTVDVDNIHINTTHRVLTLRFLREQIGFDGSAHVIEADVRGIDSRNVVDEIARLLSAAGCTPDAATFASAQAYATANGMLVDCDHGALANGTTGQRRYRAILEDLLFIARGSLYRTATGDYAIVQDRTGTSIASTNEDEGDLLEVTAFHAPPRPNSIGISYRPNAADPSKITHTIARDVPGGATGEDRPREVRYLSDHTAADRLLCYLALRAQYNRRVKFKQFLESRALGDIVSLASPSVGIYSSMPVWIDRTDQIPAGVDCEAVEYVAAVHTYTPGTLPPDASDTYQPDYSQTPPAAPTSLTITAGSTAVKTDGGTIARITVTAVVPVANWADIWFVAVHNVTGEQTGLLRGDLISGSIYGGTLTDLRPGEVYQLKAYAINAFNVSGVVQGTFSAVAIGGGGAVTTFTAPGYATAPATVPSCSAAQGPARLIEVMWSAVTTANLREYALERKVAAGAFTEVWRGRSRNYIDRDVLIGTAYQYRVRAVDNYGNLSASYATSGTVTPVGNLVGGSSGNDIGASTVDTANRTAVSSVSIVCSAGDALTMRVSEAVLIKTVNHGLGKLPTVGGGIFSGSGVVTVVAANPTTTTIDIVFIGAPKRFVKQPPGGTYGASYVQAQHVTHQHELDFNYINAGDTGTLYIW